MIYADDIVELYIVLERVVDVIDDRLPFKWDSQVDMNLRESSRRVEMAMGYLMQEWTRQGGSSTTLHRAMQNKVKDHVRAQVDEQLHR